MCCGVVPILFGWFLRVPSLDALVFIRKTFCDLYIYIVAGITVLCSGDGRYFRVGGLEWSLHT